MNGPKAYSGRVTEVGFDQIGYAGAGPASSGPEEASGGNAPATWGHMSVPGSSTPWTSAPSADTTQHAIVGPHAPDIFAASVQGHQDTPAGVAGFDATWAERIAYGDQLAAELEAPTGAGGPKNATLWIAAAVVAAVLILRR